MLLVSFIVHLYDYAGRPSAQTPFAELAVKYAFKITPRVLPNCMIAPKLTSITTGGN